VLVLLTSLGGADEGNSLEISDSLTTWLIPYNW